MDAFLFFSRALLAHRVSLQWRYARTREFSLCSDFHGALLTLIVSIVRGAFNVHKGNYRGDQNNVGWALALAHLQ